MRYGALFNWCRSGDQRVSGHLIAGGTMRRALRRPAVVPILCAVLLIDATPAPIGQESIVASTRQARLAGRLDQASELARAGLAAADRTPSLAVHLYVELARVWDRRGLHHNSRPVAEAWAFADSAAALLPAEADQLRAVVLSLRAELAYRAEMGTDFATARAYATDALILHRATGDAYGEAEAVHRLGLIALQTGRFSDARRLIEDSRRIDESAGARPFFQGEYERHIALVELAEGDREAAIPHLERSLERRREAGALDAAMFAANTLASTLLDAGRARDALGPLHYAVTMARTLDSPFGTARNSFVSGQLHAALGEVEAARVALEEAIRLAEATRSEGLARQAAEALDRVRGHHDAPASVPTPTHNIPSVAQIGLAIRSAAKPSDRHGRRADLEPSSRARRSQA